MKWQRKSPGFFESAGDEYIHGVDQPNLAGRYTITRIPRYEVADNQRGESAMFDTLAECKAWVESVEAL